MKIAQVSPLIESVPPSLYGGTERIVGYLTECLVQMGHDVTLYASGDSRTSARLVPMCSRALRLDPDPHDPVACHLVMLDRLLRDLDDYDVVHFHIDYLHFPLIRNQSIPHLTTLHNRQDLSELRALYAEYDDIPVVTISDSQRRQLPPCNWIGTVYHGLPLDLFDVNPRGGDYLAFVGRISPAKGPDRAIEIARRAGITLKIAAKVDAADKEYFDACIRPLLDGPYVEFIGEISDAEKNDFYGNAMALLFPIDWPEPFGLVMIESMACGTPVIAWRNGSVPEIIDDGVTGRIVDSLDEAVAAIGEVVRYDRTAVRRRFEERFDARRMAADYVSLYEQLQTVDFTLTMPQEV